MWEAMTMTQTLIIALSALAIIALSEPLSEKLRLATPVILLVVGGALSFLPQFAGFEVDPDLIIEVILRRCCLLLQLIPRYRIFAVT